MRYAKVSWVVLAQAAVMAAGQPGSAQTPGVFFRQADRAEVMMQYQPNLYCHVQNENQMAAYGGMGQVQVVPQLHMAGTQTGDCGWPNGFYRKGTDPAVYRLYGTGQQRFNLGESICHVTNEQQMAAYGGFSQVRAVSATSDLGRGRSPVVECPNPTPAAPAPAACTNGATRCAGTYVGRVRRGNNPPAGAAVEVCRGGAWQVREACNPRRNLGCYAVDDPATGAVVANCAAATARGE